MPNLSIYEQDLDRNAANFVALSPVSFVERSAEVFGDLEAVVHGARRYTLAQTRERSARLAAALRAFGVGRGTTVSVMLHNTPEMVEAHYAVPALERGAQHAEHAARRGAARLADEPLRGRGADHRPRVLADDRRGAASPAREHGRAPIVIDVCDSEYAGPGERLGAHEYEALLAAHAPLARLDGPADEWDAIAVVVHLGHDRRPEGRGHASPRRLPERGLQRRHLDHAALPDATCGPCRCSTATAGASRGRWRCSAARTSACAGSRPRRSSTRCASTASTTTAPRRSCTAC